MAVVVRLHGLPASAGAADIRHFFTGLSIPDGGVHIIGGELGEAFISFETSKDARRALTRSGGIIRGVKMQLYLSSQSELEYAIETSRRRIERSEREPSKRSGTSTNAGVEDKLSTLVAAIKQGISKSSFAEPSYPDIGGMNTNGSRYSSASAKAPYDQARRDPPYIPKAGYLWLRGMPFSVTENEIRDFFHGLHVSGLILLKDHQGRNNGKGVVKFDTPEETMAGLKRHKQYIGPRFVEISLASEEEWVAEGGTVEAPVFDDHARKRYRSPPFTHDYVKSKSHSRSRSPKRYRSRSHSLSPKRYRSRSHSPDGQDFSVHMKNLSYSTEKRDVIKFFKGSDLNEDQIKFLYDSKNNRTREAFVLFKNKVDYFNALCHHKETLATRLVYVFPISKTAMLDMLQESGYRLEPTNYRDRQMNLFSERSFSDEKTCIYVRNLPCDATKDDVRKLFEGFELSGGDIHLLYDNAGIGLGEALVKFKSERHAHKAEQLYNRRVFLGAEVLLRLISEDQMKKFGVNVPSLEAKSDTQSYAREYDRGGDSGLYDVPGPARSHDVLGPARPFDVPGPARPFDVPGPARLFLSDNFRPTLSKEESYDRFDMRNRMDDYVDGGFKSQSGFRSTSVNVDGLTTVKLENLPFKVSIEEILDFFHGYDIIPDSLSLEFNQKGGRAVISLRNYAEAIAAVQELNDKPIGLRKIRVSFS